jgi:hypothetical protein
MQKGTTGLLGQELGHYRVLERLGAGGIIGAWYTFA